jgi:hypothetical protein
VLHKVHVTSYVSEKVIGQNVKAAIQPNGIKDFDNSLKYNFLLNISLHYTLHIHNVYKSHLTSRQVGTGLEACGNEELTSHPI